MGEFRMPSLGADMTEGALVEWLVQPGDAVVKGQAIAVVDTAKSAIEIECFEAGVVRELLVEPGTTVAVGTALAVLADADAQDAAPAADKPGKAGKVRKAGKAGTAKAAVAGEQAAPRKPAARRKQPAENTEPPPATSTAAVPAPAPMKQTTEKTEPSPATGTTTAPPPAPAKRPVPDGGPAPSRTSPLVRRLARERGVDLGAVHGSGPGGRVTRTDVEAAVGSGRIRSTPYARRLAAELGVALGGIVGSGPAGAIRAGDVRAAAAARTPAARPVVAADRTAARRHAIAELMSRAKREIPHYYLSTTVDLSAAMTWMREHNRGVPVAERLVPAALLVKAAAVAARRVPELNGFWIDDTHVRPDHVHLGIAISLREGGLVAPALHDADTLSLPDVMAGLRDLVRRARAGRLRASETADPTITVTDLGDQGVETVFGVIYPPQVALVGYGRVLDRPTAVDGLLGVRPCVTATLSADHRAGDGAVGARYLTTVDRLLQHPEDL